MAFIVSQPFQTTFGTQFSGSYWRWVDLSVDVMGRVVSVLLNAYVSPQAFADGRAPIAARHYQLIGQDFFDIGLAVDGPQPQGLSQTIYAYIKSHDSLFADAIEV